MLTMGFEFEFLHPFGSTAKLIEELKSIDIEAQFSLPDRIPHYKSWWVTADGSIRNLGCTLLPIELISPPMPIDEAKTWLFSVVRFLRDTNCITNQSTALHVGLGHTDKDYLRNLDELKLIMLLDEYKLLNAYDRKSNAYSRSHLSQIRKRISEGEHKKWAKKIESIDDLRDSVAWNKYYSVNLTKLPRYGYVEFRIIGGEDYHMKTALLEKTIDQFLYAFEAALNDKDQEKFEYLANKMLDHGDWVRNQIHRNSLQST